jgi:hypothetical protein
MIPNEMGRPKYEFHSSGRHILTADISAIYLKPVLFQGYSAKVIFL